MVHYLLKPLVSRTKISHEMKKSTHTMGTKSYADWPKNIVSHLLFINFIYNSSYFFFTAIFSRKADLEKKTAI